MRSHVRNILVLAAAVALVGVFLRNVDRMDERKDRRALPWIQRFANGRSGGGGWKD